MNSNNLKDISKIYLEQVSAQLDEKKKENPKFWWNDDGDDTGYEEGEVSGKFRRKRKSVKEALIGKQSKIDANNNGQIDAQDFKILRSTKKKKQVKEGFSNWREDLIEIVDKISKDKSEDVKITEKEVNNKIDINPKLNLGERVEELGGTLLEMSEIEEFDQIFDDLTESEIFLLSDSLIEKVVEEFFYECIEEGYDLQEIENTLLESIELSNALLTEAEVTYGHDTDIKKDRLEKVKSAVKKVGRGLVRGAGYAAGLAVRGAKAVKRELGKGYQRGRYGASGGSGSSETTSSRETQTTSGDGGESEDKKPGLLSRIGAKLKRGLVKVARSVSRGARNVARRLDDKQGKTQERRPRVTQGRSESGDAEETQGRSSRPQARTTRVSSSSSSEDPEEIRKRVRPGTSGWGERALEMATGISAREREQSARRKKAQEQSESYSGNQEYQLIEKAESEQQQKIFGLALSVKRGKTPRSEVSDRVLKIVDGMGEKEIRKFAKTKHEGIPHKVEAKEEVIRQELIARMISKIEEQSEIYVDEAKLPSSMKKGKKTRESKVRLKLTDCDDCTHDQRHPDAAKIDVVNPEGEKTHSLTPGEFAKHQLPSGHKYGFDQFRKTKIVKDTTKPNKRIVNFLNREDYSMIDERIRRYPEQRGVTARGSMDDNRGFTQDMKSRIGVKNLKAVHFVGDIKKGSGPEKKATVAKQIVSKRPDAKEVHFVDDHPGNVKAVTDTLAKPGKTVKGKVGRTRETGPKVKGFVAKPATKAKGTVKVGEVVQVRLGGEGREGNRGIRSNTSPSKSPQETQKRRKQQKMKEEFDI